MDVRLLMDPPSRLTLHRVAAHVLGRRRYQVSGRFGLRAGPRGIVTPAFGPGPEILRVAGDFLVREQGGAASYQPLGGSSLRDLAEFSGADLAAEFPGGSDTPELGDTDEPLLLSARYIDAVADWLALAWRVLDRVVGELAAAAEPATLQLWPEHFDVGTSVGVDPGSPEARVNLGASPGDGFSEAPYFYVGPWSPDRPGDPAYWNAPFGAALTVTQLEGSADAAEAAAQFFTEGIRLASQG